MKFKFTHKQLVAFADIVCFSYRFLSFNEREGSSFTEQDSISKAFIRNSQIQMYKETMRLVKKLLEKKDKYNFNIREESINVLNGLKGILIKNFNNDPLKYALLTEFYVKTEQQFNSPPKPLHI